MGKNYTYITKEGDSFDLLALRYYNNEKLANRIIEENPDYADSVILDGGITLSIPVIEKPVNNTMKAPWRQ